LKDLKLTIYHWIYHEVFTNGVNYQIDWPTFLPGSSIFIPAIDTESAIKAIQKESERLEFQFVHKVVIEDHVKGIRVWRL
jgi:hypothetical protein